jgi:hypothetical protein
VLLNAGDVRDLELMGSSGTGAAKATVAGWFPHSRPATTPRSVVITE